MKKNTKKQWISLHQHSHQGSILDGLSKIPDLINRCSSLGMNSVALTDHGSLSGCIELNKLCRKNNLKSILGIEFYICDGESTLRNNENKHLSHLVILSKNKEGWNTLIQMISRANHPDNFYYKPRLNLNNISEYDTSNLIFISGHLGSTIADKLIKNDKIVEDWKTIGRNIVQQHHELFGDNFFLEVQNIDRDNTPLSQDLSECIRFLSKEFKIHKVATADAHYSYPQQWEDHKIILATNLHLSLKQIYKDMRNGNKVPLEVFFKPNSKYYIPSSEEISVVALEDEIENSVAIADMCEDYSITHDPIFPEFNCPDGQDHNEYLKKLCRQGWLDRNMNTITSAQKDIYSNRFNTEYEVIKEAGLSPYFLIVQDFVKWAKNNNIYVGASRGSAGGSLISYLLQITDIDPIQYGLIFERFYNAARKGSMPDIDVDLEKHRREDVVQYISNKYGHDKVASISNFGRLMGRGALKDTLRAYDILTFAEINDITKHVPDKAMIDDELQEAREQGESDSIIYWALKNKSAKLSNWARLNEKGEIEGDLAKQFEQAIRLEGTIKNISKHASAKVISPIALDKICPLVYDKDNNAVLAVDMRGAEDLGLLKFDLLGLGSLSKMHDCVDLINSRYQDLV